MTQIVDQGSERVACHDGEHFLAGIGVSFSHRLIEFDAEPGSGGRNYVAVLPPDRRLENLGANKRRNCAISEPNHVFADMTDL